MEKLYGTNFMCAVEHSSSSLNSCYSSSESLDDDFSEDVSLLNDNCSNCKTKGKHNNNMMPSIQTNNLSSSFALNSSQSRSIPENMPEISLSDRMSISPWQNKFQNKLSARYAKPQSEDAPESTVFIRKNSSTFFKLTFIARNVVMVPLFLKQRMFQETLNDKIIQTNSQFFYDYKIDYRVVNYPLNYANYKLHNDSYTGFSKDRSTTSCKNSKGKVKLKSSIYIKKGSVLFNLKTSYMNLDLVRTANICEEYQNTVNKSADPRDLPKNRGSLILRIKDDLIQITFDMTNIFFDRHIPTMSKGTQFETDTVYYKEFSEVVKRFVYVPVPITTYVYHNPIPKVLYENMTRALNGVDPRWMSAERRKRILQTRGIPVADIKKERTELKNQNSNVVFQSESKTFRCVHGIFTGLIEEGDIEYENTIIDYFRRKTVAKRKYGGEDLCIDERKIPDWNFNYYFG